MRFSLTRVVSFVLCSLLMKTCRLQCVPSCKTVRDTPYQFGVLCGPSVSGG